MKKSKLQKLYEKDHPTNTIEITEELKLDVALYKVKEQLKEAVNIMDIEEIKILTKVYESISKDLMLLQLEDDLGISPNARMIIVTDGKNGIWFYPKNKVFAKNKMFRTRVK